MSADQKPMRVAGGVFDGWQSGDSGTHGVSRHIETIAGASYSLGFDMGGSAGFDASTTAISVLLDGRPIASYDLTSVESTLNWQHANVNFTGSGGIQTLSIVAESGDHARGGDRLHNNAALVDTGGEEGPRVVLSGMPVGTTLSDGAHSVTTTSDNPSVDITGWTTSKLSITTPANYSGPLTLQATTMAPKSAAGSQARVSQSLKVQADAMAQVPTLTLSPPAVSVSRSLISTRWENVCNNGYNATIINTSQFAGWNATPVARGKKPAFEVWANADQGKSARGRNQSVQAAGGAGREWLGLSNGVGSVYQAPGIAQTIKTIPNAQYTFNFNYAGQLGLSSANTQIGVYLDGQLLGVYSNVSTTSPNWQTLGFRLKGDGNSHTLSIQLSNGTNTGTPRGAMLDAIRLVETLPGSESAVYGFVGSPIALPQIGDQLAACNPGLTLVGLPVGALVKDGKNSAIMANANTALNITSWCLNSLTVTIPHGTRRGGSIGGSIDLQVVATCVEPSNGSMARIAKNVTVQLLSGQPCATPVGVNPYVNYANSNSVLRTTEPGDIVMASALVPVSSSYSVAVPAATITQPPTAADLNTSLETLLDKLSDSVGVALVSEFSKLKH